MPALIDSTSSPCIQRPKVCWWLWPQVLGLDAPLVAVIWLAALARSHRVHLWPEIFVTLFAATWTIYLLDRTADALSGQLAEPLNARHEFCRRHQAWLMSGLVPALMLGGCYVALWRLPSALGTYAFALGMLSAWYLAFHGGRDKQGLQKSFVLMALGGSIWMMLQTGFSWWWQAGALVMLVGAATTAWHGSKSYLLASTKEVFAGLLFALGCVAGVHVWGIDHHAMLCTETMLLWFLATLNMLLIHCNERETGQQAKAEVDQAAFRLNVPLQRCMIVVVLIVAVYHFVQSGNTGARAIAMAAAATALLMLCLHMRVRKLEPHRFHLLADAALVLPLPLVLWLSPT